MELSHRQQFFTEVRDLIEFLRNQSEEHVLIGHIEEYVSRTYSMTISYTNPNSIRKLTSTIKSGWSYRFIFENTLYTDCSSRRSPNRLKALELAIEYEIHACSDTVNYNVYAVSTCRP